MRMFYFAYFTGAFSILLAWASTSSEIESLRAVLAIFSVFLRYVYVPSMFVLLILYIAHIFIEGFEKPKVILGN